MSEPKNIIVLVLDEVNEEALSEVIMLLDMLHGSDRVLISKVARFDVQHMRVHQDDLYVFWTSRIDEDLERALRSISHVNNCLVIYEGNQRLDIKSLIRANVHGIISSGSIAELPNALSEVSNQGYFICQKMLKTLLGGISKYRFDEVLSTRELEVLNLLSRGLTYMEISTNLHISYDTTKTHTYNIYKKLGARNKAEAVYKARNYMILS